MLFNRGREIDYQGVEATWPLAFSRKSTQQENQTPEDYGKLRNNQEDEAGAYRCGGTRDGLTPPGYDMDLIVGREWQSGGVNR